MSALAPLGRRFAAALSAVETRLVATRFRFRHLAAATTALTFVLVLLGVYTAASASGLSCSAQWPLCDGGLLPQTLPSFVEWFHRLVAMITGFFILGTTVGAWRYYDERRIRAASLLALVALPPQVILGGATVFTYTPVVQTTHHGAALLIYTGLVATTLWVYEADRAAARAASAATRTDETAASAGD